MRRLVPDAITLASAMVAVIGITRDTLSAMAVCVLVCAVLDSIDGRLARRWHVASRFGRELDSSADLIAFGILPAVMLHHIGVPLPFVLLYAGTVQWRISRHNTQPTASIVGATSNLCACLLALLVLTPGGWEAEDRSGLSIIVVFFCIMMVQKFVIAERDS